MISFARSRFTSKITKISSSAADSSHDGHNSAVHTALKTCDHDDSDNLCIRKNIRVIDKGNMCPGQSIACYYQHHDKDHINCMNSWNNNSNNKNNNNNYRSNTIGNNASPGSFCKDNNNISSDGGDRSSEVVCCCNNISSDCGDRSSEVVCCCNNNNNNGSKKNTSVHISSQMIISANESSSRTRRSEQKLRFPISCRRHAPGSLLDDKLQAAKGASHAKLQASKGASHAKLQAAKGASHAKLQAAKGASHARLQAAKGASHARRLETDPYRDIARR